MIDLETSCNVPKCVGNGPGNEGRCDHALNPYTAKIDLCAIVTHNTFEVYDKGETAVPRIEELEKQGYSFAGHGFKFDIKFLRYKWYHMDLKEWSHCSLIAAHTCNTKISGRWLINYEFDRLNRNKNRKHAHRKAGPHSLKTLAPYFLDVEPFWEAESYNDTEYVLKDAVYTFGLLCYFLTNMTADELDFYRKKALPGAKLLLRAEERGITCSRDRLGALETKMLAEEIGLKQQLDDLWKPGHQAYREKLTAAVNAKYENMKRNKLWEARKQAALSKVPVGFDYESPAQMKWFFKDYCGYNLETFEGDESTGKGVLERLADEGNEDVGLFLKYRKAQKILTGFLPTYHSLMDEEGVIRPTYHSTGTRTGRLSCSDPNLQQVSKQLKHLFVPRPGYKFLTYDLSAIEAKLIAFYADDPALYEIIEKGWSIHDYNVKAFLGKQEPIEQIAALFPAARKACKTTGFALFYGAGPKRIRESFAQAGFVLSMADAKNIHRNFKETYESSVSFHSNLTATLEEGEVYLNAVGRPIAIQAHENAFMQGFNRLVQSSASDINWLSIALPVQEAYDQLQLDAHLLLLIHDSVTFEVRADQVEQAEKILLDKYAKLKLVSRNGPITITAEGEVSNEWK